jgi:hypothetical protein
MAHLREISKTRRDKEEHIIKQLLALATAALL